MKTFWEWLSGDLKAQPLRTPDQLLVPTIAAFKDGLTWRELYQRFKPMDRKVLDELLAAFVEIGQITMAVDGDDVRYRVRAAMPI